MKTAPDRSGAVSQASLRGEVYTSITSATSL